MNNRMAINTCLSTIESKKETKQTRRGDRIMDVESFLMAARLGVRSWGMGKEVRRLRSTNR